MMSIKCFLCDNERAEQLPHEEAALIRYIKCPNCGEYKITEQVIIEIAKGIYNKGIYPIVSGDVFDAFYYKNEVKVVKIDDFKSTKVITTSEKLYKLAKYFFTENQKGNQDLYISQRPSCCYQKNDINYSRLMNTLKRHCVINFIDAADDDEDYTSHFVDIEVTTEATCAFEKGIDNAQQFEEVFMNTDKSGGTIIKDSTFINSPIQTGDNNTLTNAITPTISIIRDKLKENGVSELQIATIEPEIVEIAAETDKEAIDQTKLKTIFSKIAEKTGTFMSNILIQVISQVIAKKLGG
jgi:ribosomal protein L32